MSRMSPKEILNKVRETINRSAKSNGISPSEVDASKFWLEADGITEWQIRKLGGFTQLRDTLFPKHEKNEAHEKHSLSVIVNESPVKKSKKFRPVNQKLQNFQVHGFEMADLFNAAGLGPNEIFRMVVQPDTHVPDHDPVAINAFCEFLEFYKPHGLINLGDFMDMNSVTHWKGGDSKPKRLIPEIQKGKSLLSRIEKAAGPQCQWKAFIKGNHEDWLDQYLNERIPEVLDGIEDLKIDLSIESLLSLAEFGYHFIPLNEILRVGEANFIHGYYTSMHHAKKHLDVFGVNIYYGHLHDVQSHSAVNVKAVHESMSLGCLRSLHAHFLKGKPNNWSHAFGVFEYRYDGSFTRYVPIIVDGKFSFHGRIFDGNENLIQTY